VGGYSRGEPPSVGSTEHPIIDPKAMFWAQAIKFLFFELGPGRVAARVRKKGKCRFNFQVVLQYSMPLPPRVPRPTIFTKIPSH
jgi:hypothetical protein